MNFWRFEGADLDPSARLVGEYDLLLVFLSFAVACIASVAALEIIDRVTAASPDAIVEAGKRFHLDFTGPPLGAEG